MQTRLNSLCWLEWLMNGVISLPHFPDFCFAKHAERKSKFVNWQRKTGATSACIFDQWLAYERAPKWGLGRWTRLWDGRAELRVWGRERMEGGRGSLPFFLASRPSSSPYTPLGACWVHQADISRLILADISSCWWKSSIFPEKRSSRRVICSL